MRHAGIFYVHFLLYQRGKGQVCNRVDCTLGQCPQLDEGNTGHRKTRAHCAGLLIPKFGFAGMQENGQQDLVESRSLR